MQYKYIYCIFWVFFNSCLGIYVIQVIFSCFDVFVVSVGVLHSLSHITLKLVTVQLS